MALKVKESLKEKVVLVLSFKRENNRHMAMERREGQWPSGRGDLWAAGMPLVTCREAL